MLPAPNNAGSGVQPPPDPTTRIVSQNAVRLGYAEKLLDVLNQRLVSLESQMAESQQATSSLVQECSILRRSREQSQAQTSEQKIDYSRMARAVKVLGECVDREVGLLRERCNGLEDRIRPFPEVVASFERHSAQTRDALKVLPRSIQERFDALGEAQEASQSKMRERIEELYRTCRRSVVNMDRKCQRVYAVLGKQLKKQAKSKKNVRLLMDKRQQQLHQRQQRQQNQVEHSLPELHHALQQLAERTTQVERVVTDFLPRLSSADSERTALQRGFTRVQSSLTKVSGGWEERLHRLERAQRDSMNELRQLRTLVSQLLAARAPSTSTAPIPTLPIPAPVTSSVGVSGVVPSLQLPQVSAPGPLSARGDPRDTVGGHIPLSAPPMRPLNPGSALASADRHLGAGSSIPNSPF